MMILQGDSLGCEKREWVNPDTGQVRVWWELALVSDRDVISVALPDGATEESLGLHKGREVALVVTVRPALTRAGAAVIRYRIVGVTSPLDEEAVTSVEPARAARAA